MHVQLLASARLRCGTAWPQDMVKPAFIFDGRNILDHDQLRSIGYIVYALGKPLDPFMQKNYS